MVHRLNLGKGNKLKIFSNLWCPFNSIFDGAIEVHATKLIQRIQFSI